jgi:hypothetical protein
VAERLKLTNEISGATLLVDSSLVEVGSKVGKASVRIGEQVPDDDQDRTRHGDEGALATSSANEASERSPRKVSVRPADEAASARTRFR